jgi:NitT/TauT family transport system ATP-binding protein
MSTSQPSPDMETTPLPGVVFPNSELPDIVELREVNQTYQNGTVNVLQGFNLLVEDIPGQGQFEVILGKSGCGKSTVLRYLTGLQKPTSGEILLAGKPLPDHPRIPMVFQKYSSLEWLTVLENVEFPLKIRGVPRNERRELALKILAEVGLADHANKFAKEPGLSGGQMQRVAIARSLVANPGIIMMDEPYGALDTITRMRMQIMLHDLWTRIQSTILFVTHDLAEAVFLGTRIHVMSSPPGAHITKVINVDLPLKRNKDTKRSSRFLELLAEVEDAMELIGYTHGSK